MLIGYIAFIPSTNSLIGCMFRNEFHSDNCHMMRVHEHVSYGTDINCCAVTYLVITPFSPPNPLLPTC